MSKLFGAKILLQDGTESKLTSYVFLINRLPNLLRKSHSIKKKIFSQFLSIQSLGREVPVTVGVEVPEPHVLHMQAP